MILIILKFIHTDSSFNFFNLKFYSLYNEFKIFKVIDYTVYIYTHIIYFLYSNQITLIHIL